ncbi:MAG: ABC transporter substrate-binding protein [Solirubrobacterales bacterium]
MHKHQDSDPQRVGTPADPQDLSGLTRKRFLSNTAVASLGVAAGGGLLSACGGSSSSSSSTGSSTSTGASSGPPPRGGRIQLAWIGAGASESFNPATVAAPIDTFRLYCVFDPLVRAAPDYKTEPGLALKWEPNADGTVYEITLRDGVTWHDGKPFTADDVIYTWRLMGDPAHFGHASVLNVDLNSLKKLSPTKMRVQLKKPDFGLAELFVFHNSTMVVQDGTTDYSKPIGTGPFIVESFEPGQRAVFKRNPNYWQEGKPYIDQLEAITVEDEAARVNGLLSGAFNVIGSVPYQQVSSLEGNSAIKLLEGVSGPNQVIVMRVDQPPFNDPRVSLAMKLIADRPGLISAMFSGRAEVLNDMAGKGLPHYNSSLPQREQDLEQAKSLLKQAGQADLKVTLNTTSGLGMVNAATAYAEQAKGAGVSVQLNNISPDVYNDPAQGYLSYGFSQDTWPMASLAAFYSQTLLSKAGVNETHFGDASTDNLFYEAQGAPSAEQREAAWQKLQKIQYDEGGNIVWAARKPVDAMAPNVGGFYPGWFWPLGNFNPADWWIES